MHTRPPSKSICSLRALRLGLVASLVLVMFVAPKLLRSQTMPTRPASSAPELTLHERLMQLVPDMVGEWKRHTVNRARPRIDGGRPPTVLAEFRHGKFRAQVSVTQGAPGPVPVLSAPVEHHSVTGSEKAYSEGGVRVSETHRVADGRTEVTVVRDDGIFVVAHSIGVAASELKALALGIKSAARRS
jgi:hypothetical protein